MKKTIVIAIHLLLLTAVIDTANANTCNIKLLLKKKDAKTYYLISGEKISKKVFEKLSGICSTSTEVMSSKQLKEIKIKELEEKLNKLKGIK